MAGAAVGALQGAKGPDVRPGVPWRPLGSGALCLDFAWQAQHLVLCKGPDVRPGVPSRPLGSGALCWDFARQARHLVLCAWILRGRRSTWCKAQVAARVHII